jgi:hypothetical protein
MQFGWTADEASSFAVMDAFVEAGGNFLDTADVYSRWAPGNPGGVSEEIIGRWMKARGNRHQLVIATKVRGQMWEGPDGEGLSRAHIRAAEDSLRPDRDHRPVPALFRFEHSIGRRRLSQGADRRQGALSRGRTTERALVRR